MSNKHTPEPWQVLEVHGEVFVAANTYEGHPYHNRTRTIEIMSDEDYPTKEADAHRIAACVNACEGISTDMLEQVGKLITPSALNFHQLNAQRDELLAALKLTLPVLEHFRKNYPIDDTIFPLAIARTAIAKAEGGT
ncbi:MAG: hypothetical protein ACR652_18625 [Methylocystis sp.]|uniref:hypothetical protein n=1 Tax=Methylocystis sp. TaxID=1911079 RepID=UPI003DA5B7E3